MSCIKTVIAVICVFTVTSLYAQNNKQQLQSSNLLDTSAKVKTNTTVITKDSTVKDTLVKKKHDPRKATRRSALIPGWGQAYNREYWKIPIVYGALAIPAATYIYNNKWYKRTKVAFDIVANEETDRYGEIDPKLIRKDTGLPLDAQSLQFYRNQFRRDRDYSILFFLIAWGVNVVDATVFGHLKDFDVSDNLSMQVQPGYDPSLKKLNVGLAFNIKTPQRKLLPAF